MIMVVAVPYPLLRAWYKYMAEVQKHKNQQKKAASNLDCNISDFPCNNDGTMFIKTTYVDLWRNLVSETIDWAKKDNFLKKDCDK